VETLCYAVIVGYNINNAYPFSTYGDGFACWLQNIAVCALLVWFRRPKVVLWLTAALAFLAFNYYVVSGICGMQVLIWLQVRSSWQPRDATQCSTWDADTTRAP
jgi:hypothetical protein